MIPGLRIASSEKAGNSLLPILNRLFRITTSVTVTVLFWAGVPQPGAIPNAAAGALSASLDKSSVKVGGTVSLIVTYHLPEGARLPEKPVIKGVEGLSVLEQNVTPSQIRLRLLVDQLGEWKSESLSLSYVTKSGKTETISTNPVSLTVLSNLGGKPDEARLRPIQGIIPTRAWWFSYLLWGTIVACLLLLGAGILWWYNKKMDRRALPAIAPDPPHIRARKEIERLEAKRLFEKGYIKEFYFTFSEILRRYVEAIRNFPAAEFTTEEISRHLTVEVDRNLLPLLRQVDLIKFADMVPTPAGREEDIKAALSYIEETSLCAEKSEEGKKSPGCAP